MYRLIGLTYLNHTNLSKEGSKESRQESGNAFFSSFFHLACVMSRPVPQSLSCHHSLLPLYCSIHTHFYFPGCNLKHKSGFKESGLLKYFQRHTLRVVYLAESGSNNERNSFKYNLNKTHDLYPSPSFTLAFNLT